MRDRVLLRSLMLAIVMVLFVAACSSDEPAAGPVTFEIEVDFSSRPTGTFEVTEGADVLGCSSGTFGDSGHPINEDVQRVMTCDSGSNEGSFRVALSFEAIAGTVSDNGTWSVVEGSNDFDGLQGSGDWSIVYSQPGDVRFRFPAGGSGVGTWTGDINYTS